MLRRWDDIPSFMRCDEVKDYYNSLSRKRLQLLIKRGFDYLMAVVLLVAFSIPMFVIALAIKMDSKGPVIFRQKRVTSYGKCFYIHKFRSMYGGDKSASVLAARQDKRITRVGSFLRKTRLDELPQLYDILAGHMSFVGTRPEVPEFVSHYSKEMFATLLLPAGITSRASIRFRDEALLFNGVAGADRIRIYREEILPEKMEENLKEIREFSILNDVKTMIRTVSCVL